MTDESISIPEKLEHWPRARLKRFNRNPRTHSEEQVQELAAFIRDVGWTNPILVDIDTEEILAGHGRLAAAEFIDMDPLPVIPLSGLNESQRKAIVIADNRLAENAGWDEALLGELLGELRDEEYDISLLGFDEEELDALLPDEDDDLGDGTGVPDEDDVPEPTENPVSQEGDLWRLGKHRLLCGDSTSQAAAVRLMGGDEADALWTDPPYNVNYESKAGKIQNDHMSADLFGAFLRDVYKTAISVMRPGAPAYIAHADTEGEAFRREFREAGFYLSGCLIWRKNSLVLGRSDHHWQHEPILYGWKPGAAHSWYGERNKTTIFEFDEEPVQQLSENEWQIGEGETALVITGDNIQIQRARGTVFFEEKPRSNAIHPTMKPVALIERMLQNSTKRGDAVLDLFGGSGSTLIACEKLARTAKIMGLDPKFVDVIIHRWQEYTGREARLDSTGESFAETRARRVQA